MTPKGVIYIKEGAEDALLGFPLFEDQWLDDEEYLPDRHVIRIYVFGDKLYLFQRIWLDCNPQIEGYELLTKED